MSKNIMEMYRAAGVSAPSPGKGIHTARAHRCVIRYRTAGVSKDEAWRRCMGGIGRNKAVKRAHWRGPAKKHD